MYFKVREQILEVNKCGDVSGATGTGQLGASAGRRDERTGTSRWRVPVVTTFCTRFVNMIGDAIVLYALN